MPCPRPTLMLILPIMLALCSCQGENVKTTRPAEELRIQGTLIRSDGTVQLQACDGKRRYPLLPADTDLIAEMDVLGDAPGLFADIEGVISEASQGDRGSLRVTKIHRLHHEGFGCDDPDFPNLFYRASGNEPFWRTLVQPGGMTTTRLGEDALRLAYTVERTRDGRRHFRSADPEHDVELILTPEPCHDGMSGARMSFSATLRWDDVRYRGCAAPGALRDD